MKQFVLTGVNSGIEMTYKFDVECYLVGFELIGQVNETQRNWFMENMPRTIKDLRGLSNTNSTLKLTEVEPDLSFNRFWHTYNHKHGNKKRAEKLWEKLPKHQQAKAMNWIATYNRQLHTTGVNKLNPETYLAQQRWNN